MHHNWRIIAPNNTKITLHFERHAQVMCNYPLTKGIVIYYFSNYDVPSCSVFKPHQQLFPIMMRLHVVFSNHTSNYRDMMIWAACCLAYFGLLRVSEFTASSPGHFDSSTGLLLSDIALDNRASPTLVQITLKQSKGDQFRKRTQICLGKMTQAICPV